MYLESFDWLGVFCPSDLCQENSPFFVGNEEWGQCESAWPAAVDVCAGVHLLWSSVSSAVDVRVTIGAAGKHGFHW